METAIQLTEAEMKMIALKREEDALQARKEAIKREQEIAKNIVNAEEAIKKFQGKQDEKNLETRRYFNQLLNLDIKFELKVTDCAKPFISENYNTTTKEYEVYFDKSVPYTDLQIVYGEFEIDVVECFEFPKGGYRHKNLGYKMGLPEQSYKL